MNAANSTNCKHLERKTKKIEEQFWTLLNVAISFTATTIFFTLLWLLNPSVLSFISVFGLTVTICDYVVPLISRSLFKSDIWTDTEEKEYEDICTSIVLYKTKIRLSIDSYLRLRSTKPKIVSKFNGSIWKFLSWFFFLVLLCHCSNFGFAGMVGECVQ